MNAASAAGHRRADRSAREPEEVGPGYEIRVRHALGPALLSSFSPLVADTAVRQDPVTRFHASADLDLAELVRILSANGIDVLQIRRLIVDCEGLAALPELAERAEGAGTAGRD